MEDRSFWILCSNSLQESKFKILLILCSTNCWCWYSKSESGVAQSCLTLCDPWTVAYQASPSMRFSRQEYWSGFPFPSLGDLPHSRGLNLGLPHCRQTLYRLSHQGCWYSQKIMLYIYRSGHQGRWSGHWHKSHLSLRSRKSIFPQIRSVEGVLWVCVYNCHMTSLSTKEDDKASAWVFQSLRWRQAKERQYGDRIGTSSLSWPNGLLQWLCHVGWVRVPRVYDTLFAQQHPKSNYKTWPWIRALMQWIRQEA